MVKHDGFRLSKDAELQAGDILGEMAVITGSGTRNASVIAKTPVTLCVFSVETLKSFIVAEGFQDKLLQQWSLRPSVSRQPQFTNMTSTVLEKLCHTVASIFIYPTCEIRPCVTILEENRRNSLINTRYSERYDESLSKLVNLFIQIPEDPQ